MGLLKLLPFLSILTIPVFACSEMEFQVLELETIENVPTPGIYQDPNIFITISSVAGIGPNNTWLDRMIELNWNNYVSWADGDWVGLFNIDPSSLPSDHSSFALVTVPVNGSRGYAKTNVKYERFDYTEETPECLGFYIGYFHSDELVGSKCFSLFPKWMHDTKEIIGDVPLTKLMIPGSHDAGAWRLYQGALSENILIRYSVNQEESIFRQLMHGIRYLDVRVACYPGTAEIWWVNHGSTIFRPLITLFDDIKEFVRISNEIVFMDFHGFPVGFDTLDTHEELLIFVLEHMGDLLLLKSDSSDPTPNEVWEAKRPVILTYAEGRISSKYDFLWPYLTHAWGNKNQVDELEEYFNITIPAMGCNGRWWSAMVELTGNNTDPILRPLVGLRGFAQMVNIPLTYWYERSDWYSYSNIISTDYVLGNNIVEMSIKANVKRAVCNQSY